DAEYHCPLAPDDPDPDGMRKPGSGMFRRAAREHGLDLARSAFVGDRLRDVVPAREAGGAAILVRSSQTELGDAPRSVAVVDTLAEAVERILGGVAPA
ncbi:MAG: HAD hydrolase-like protein, partial [Gemmatimonadota bacterium]|nr:HAD hydrolase-like protein [Gemmatimonadota bacterium]